jgi:hypothetical protein
MSTGSGGPAEAWTAAFALPGGAAWALLNVGCVGGGAVEAPEAPLVANAASDAAEDARVGLALATSAHAYTAAEFYERCVPRAQLESVNVDFLMLAFAPRQNAAASPARDGGAHDARPPAAVWRCSTTLAGVMPAHFRIDAYLAALRQHFLECVPTVDDAIETHDGAPDRAPSRAQRLRFRVDPAQAFAAGAPFCTARFTVALDGFGAPANSSSAGAGALAGPQVDAVLLSLFCQRVDEGSDAHAAAMQQLAASSARLFASAVHLRSNQRALVSAAAASAEEVRAARRDSNARAAALLEQFCVVLNEKKTKLRALAEELRQLRRGETGGAFAPLTGEAPTAPRNEAAAVAAVAGSSSDGDVSSRDASSESDFDHSRGRAASESTSARPPRGESRAASDRNRVADAAGGGAIRNVADDLDEDALLLTAMRAAGRPVAANPVLAGTRAAAANEAPPAPARRPRQ